MFINSRISAFLLSLIIASVTSLTISNYSGIEKTTLAIISFITSFSIAFIIIYMSLEFLVFREIAKIQKILDNIGKKEFKNNIKKNKKQNLTPFMKLTSGLSVYVDSKQEEVNELRKLEIYRREFLADISHELKTPLFAAQGFIHTLLDGAMDDEMVREKFLKKAAKSLDGLNMLVQDLLLLSQIETGEMKMQITTFDILKVCVDVQEQLEHKAEKRDTKIKLNAISDIPTAVKGDRMRIYQVIANLVDNAIKYGGDTVEIQIDKGKESLEISVTDNGPGISQEHLKRIFDRFYRIEKSRNKDKGGTGLGLSIVKNVLDAHNSKIQVTSKIGKGTTFSFKLPYGKAAEIKQND